MKHGNVGNRHAIKPEDEVKTTKLTASCTQEYRLSVGKRARDFGSVGNYIRSLVDADLAKENRDER